LTRTATFRRPRGEYALGARPSPDRCAFPRDHLLGCRYKESCMLGIGRTVKLAFSRPVTQRFVVLSTPRSGTNYFISKMLLAPDILLAWEPFNRGMDSWFDATGLLQSLPDSTRKALSDLELRNRSHEEFYATAFSSDADIPLPGVSALGFKLFPNHSPDLFWNVTKDPQLKLIIIERKNRLHSFVSLLQAWRAGNWIHAPYDGRTRHVFDPVHFEIYCQLVGTTFASIRSNVADRNVSHLYLHYDRLFDENIYEKACAFLGVEYVQKKNVLKKQMKVSPLDSFSNRSFALEYLKEHYPEYLD
jgi:hypothetical protein